MFELVIDVIQTIVLIGIFAALASIGYWLSQEVTFAKYSMVMNHLNLHNQKAVMNDFDDLDERLDETIEISRKYVKRIAPEEFEEE